ncbi:MAG TPA: hypothetical protein EYQ42_12775 [Thiotrichaceae bacterium]|jgi:uncharacterized protein YifE (UPF0438 family)|nr:hypothetical protein [Thiotrichaceae bacterium]
MNNIDELRQYYLKKAPYPFCVFIEEGLFTTDEKAAINKYGYWFEAICRDKVPLTTDKLKRFRSAKERNTSDRNKWEDLWVRYVKAEVPF